MGAWSYLYDANSNLKRQTDARGQRLCFFYDALDRPTGKHYNGTSDTCPAAPTTITYSYDQGSNGKGRRTAMSSPDETTSWVYDSRGRKTQATHTVAGLTRVFNWTYDSADRITTIGYPAIGANPREVLTYTYDAGSRPASACTSRGGCYVNSGATYTALDQPKQWTLGNNLADRWDYNAPMQQLQQLRAGTNTCGGLACLFDRTYAYDPVGNVTTITDNKNAGNNQSYGYDHRDRLTRYTNPLVPLATSGDHSLVLKSDQTVAAWDSNGWGQLGDGTTTDRATPVQVSTLTGVAAVTVGSNHSLALRRDGTIWAWGNNTYGQLGDGTDTDRSTPVQVSGLSGMTAIAAGDNHSLALKADRTVWGWGYNGYGQQCSLLPDPQTPAQISGLTNITAIAAGLWHSLALKQDGTVWACGNNWSGQLGDGTSTQRNTPVQASGLTNVIAIAGGDWHSLALKQDGTVWAWGWNQQGQVGDGTTTNRTTPVQVSGLTNVIAIAGGDAHSLALKQDGTVWAWGWNQQGQVGDGTTTTRTTPVQVSGLTGAITIAAGGDQSLALKEDGTIWVWGSNTSTPSPGFVESRIPDQNQPEDQPGITASINGTLPTQITGLLGPTTIAETYTYDALGNLTCKAGTAYSYGMQSASCPHGALNKPHAVVTFGTLGLCYDQNGNLVNDGGRQYTWNAENLPLTISQVSGSETYGYDGDGERAKKVRGSSTTIYLEGLWEEVAGGAVTSLYPFNGTVVASRAGSTLSYLHADHLGSVSLATDPACAVASWQEFNPWGKLRAGSIAQTSLKYTGQRLDATGLLYYHARYYDPSLSRFISPDTLVPGLHDPQNLNRYSYVKNNPLNHTDPTGHCFWDLCFVEGALLVAGAYALGMAVAAYVVVDGNVQTVQVLSQPAEQTHLERTKPDTAALMADAVGDGGDDADAGAEKEDPLYERGSWRRQTLKDAEAEAPRNEDGEMICPSCGKTIPEKVTVNTKKGPIERRGYDLDHYPDTWSDRKEKLKAMNPPPTRKQVLDEYNRDVRVQCPECNQGHEYEGKPGDYR